MLSSLLGPLVPYKHALFKSVLEYCADSVVNSKKERDLEIPYELPSLLGIDAFPPFLKTYMEEKEKEKDQNYFNRYFSILLFSAANNDKQCNENKT